MTLRRRWTFSILAILGLFGLNLAVYVWGNAQRTAIILDLKVALERKDLAVEVRNTVEDRQRDAEVMEPLVASGSVRLSDEELTDVGDRMEAIGDLIRRLHALSESGETVRLRLEFEQLQEAWLEVYRPQAPEELAEAVAEPALPSPELPTDPDIEVGAALPDDPGLAEGEAEPVEEAAAVSSGVPRFRSLHQQFSLVVGEIERSEVARASEAEQEFSAVAALTDRITLAIFALSTLFAVGIAVWFSRFLRGTFSRYLTAEIVTSVLDTPSGLALGGEKREITVLMADLRGFSSLAERIPAEQVVAVINNFLGTMTEVIVEAGGTIDEFIGDAILVFFGAPTPRKDHAEAAVVCALKMQLAMAIVNEKNRHSGLPFVETGIGIHSGEAVVGNIGSEKRTKYAAVGQPVNLASRIEANAFGGQILVSGATLERVAAEVRVDSRFEIRPKGLDEGLAVFEIGGIGGDYDLELPSAVDTLVALHTAVPVRFSLLHGKQTEEELFDGSLIKLSPRAAVIRAGKLLEPLTDIRLELRRVGAGEDVHAYAKVVPADSSTTGAFLVRFTSLDAEASSLIDRLLASGKN